MEPSKVFESGLLYHHYANTAYPLTPASFKSFRIEDPAEIPGFLAEDWSGVEELSLYLHIPFCQVRCRFCEYAVLEGDDALHEDEYVDLLMREMALYAPLLKGRRFVGYDIGGGTPTKLSVKNLRMLTDEARRLFSFGRDVVFSIETTPSIAASEPGKIEAAYGMGYGRISMGIQTVSEKLLNDLGREGTAHIYEKAAANIRRAGFRRFNIDLMYGFLHQSDEDFLGTLRYAMNLDPDYITLYRNRYKGTKLEGEAGGVSLYKVIKQYRLAWSILNENGYIANPGKNTFSKIAGDCGTSDYLTGRVVRGTSYAGLGLGAQSFGRQYLAYNEGAASKRLDAYRKKLSRAEFPIQDIYRLNRDETMAKMVSVAFYFGFIDLDAFKKRFGLDFMERYRDETAYVRAEGLMELREGRLQLTDRGSDYINGVIPLFYSDRSKSELRALTERRPQAEADEREFLKAYDIAEFQRPSVAVDTVVLSGDGRVILIRRGEHPFMNEWALPGGFIRPGESVEDAASRKLYEETGLRIGSPADGIQGDSMLRQIGVFSDPGRDPRGWVISCAFAGRVGKSSPSTRFGEDAMDARWFDVDFTKSESVHAETSAEYRLELTDGTIRLGARGILTNGRMKVLEQRGLAFDHAEILLTVLRK